MTNQCSTTSGARIALGTEVERGALLSQLEKRSDCGLLAPSASPLHNLNAEDKDAFDFFL